MKKIELKVENTGLYGKNEFGTWEEIREELALKVPDWNEYEITNHSWIGGKKHYWGNLIDEKRNVVYTFFAVLDSEEGEVEVIRIEERIEENE